MLYTPRPGWAHIIRHESQDVVLRFRSWISLATLPLVSLLPDDRACEANEVIYADEGTSLRGLEMWSLWVRREPPGHGVVDTDGCVTGEVANVNPKTGHDLRHRYRLASSIGQVQPRLCS